MTTRFDILMRMALVAVAAVAVSGCAERRADNFRRQGDTLLSLERYTEAVPYYERATELAPGNARAHSGLGRCYAALQQYDLATQEFKAAAALDPAAHADHTQNLSILEKGGQLEAANDLARVIRGDAGASQIPSPAVAIPPSEPWQALWKRAALHELLDRRVEFEPEEGLAESLLLAALFTSNQPLVDELGAALPADSPMRGFHEAIARKDGPAAVQAVQDWAELSETRKPLREYALGYALAISGARSQAIRVYSNALKTWPDNHVGLYAIAQVFSNSHMPKLAARCLQNLLARGGENHAVRLLLFQILNEAELPAEARRNAEALYSLGPGMPENAVTLAQVYLEQNEGELAIMVLQRAVDANSNDPTLVVALAGALLRQDEPADAQARVEQLDPETAGQLTALRIGAFASARLGDWSRCESYCRQAAAAAGEPVRLLHAAAVAHQGRIDEAVELLRQVAASEDPTCAATVSPAGAAAAILQARGDHLADLAGGWAYFHARLYKAALETLEPMIATDLTTLPGALSVCILHGLPPGNQPARARKIADAQPDHPAVWLAMSKVLAAALDVEGERAALQAAGRLAPDSVDVLRAQVQFYERTGDVSQTIATYRRLAQIDPEDAAVSNNLAYALLAGNGDPAEALQLAERAAGLSGPNASILHTLGLAQYESGHFEESRNSFSQALELRPLDPTLLFDYGKALMATNQREEGQRQIELAITLADQLGLEFPRRAEAGQLLNGP